VSASLGPPTYTSFAPEELQRLARAMEQEAWLRKLPPTNPYEALRCEADGARFVLWSSGKLAYQGPRARELLEELVRGAGIAGEGGPTEIGSDEAGKGEWLGPMVVAAVAVRPAQRLGLKLDGVRDSKELGGEVRDRIAAQVQRHAAAVNVVSIGPRRFNELFEELHARGETLNDLLWWAHRKALEPVLAAVGSDAAVRVVLDEFDRTRHARDQFRGLLPAKAEMVQRPRGEDALAVAAASVLARAERDAQVRALQQRFGLDPALTPQAARAHPHAREFAKVAYLERR
jgi:ribonuclease HIII